MRSSIVLALTSALAVSASKCKPSSTADEWDYIVVGGGPAGIITAERLSEANKKVLLLERGSGPTVATGSKYAMSWNDTLTPIDVPGLTSAVATLPLWNDYICSDTASYAACVLGGGVTVNYMVFVHPPAHDFANWPAGWNWPDIAPAAERLYARNPGTMLPSADGQRYDYGSYAPLAQFFDGLGWKSVSMIDQPNEKHNVYSYPSWNIKNQMRAGPVRTYLPLALQRDNFSLRLGTKVNRVLRSGARAIGVEIKHANGTLETVKLARGGRVVLSSGALSTPRLLFNSGIGPAKQIETAGQSGITLPPRADWISLPVGEKIKDHPIFSINIATNGTWGPFPAEGVLNGTDLANIDAYEQRGAGVLTEGRHQMIWFTSRVGPDGVLRYYQGSCAPASTGVVGIKVYMTHGLTSHGVLGLDTSGNTVFEQSPYLQTDGDKAAAEAFLGELIADVRASDAGVQLVDYLNATASVASLTNGIHFTGSARLGDVVDVNARVKGMDNLFVTDASIHPDLPTGNTQAIVMVVAEAAVAKILALKE